MNMHQKIRKSPAVLPSAGELNAMLRTGMKHAEIALMFGTTSAAISVKLRRAGFDATRGYGGIRVSRKRPVERHMSPTPAVKHDDRVTRITPTGMRISLPRVTFIDGPA